MLESLTVVNFQTHSKRVIYFEEGVTTITGPTDVGKSTLARALEWICFNRPSGVSFIKHGKKKTYAKLEVDGHTIIRRRGVENSYSLDGRRLKAFGQDVPDVVNAVLNLTEENLQAQLDGPFWFDKSPGQVSRELNQIVNLSVIDHSLSFVSKEISRSKSVVEVTRERYQEARKIKKELRWVRGFDKNLRILEGKTDDLKNNRLVVTEVNSLIQEVQRSQKAHNLLTDVTTTCQDTVERARLALDQYNQLESLRELLVNVKQCISHMETLDQELYATKIEINKLMSKGCPLCGQPVPNE